jgi:hypothetical protein
MSSEAYDNNGNVIASGGKSFTYYRTRIFYSQNGPEYFSFIPADSDEGEYLIWLFPLATAHARK